MPGDLSECGAERALLHQSLCLGRVGCLRWLNQVNRYSECLEIYLGVKHRGPPYTRMSAQKGQGKSGY